MKTRTIAHLLRRSGFLTVIVFVSAVLAAQQLMNAGDVALALQGTFNEAKGQLVAAVETRLSESREVSNTVAQAKFLPADLKKDIQSDNKTNEATLTSIKTDLNKSTTTADLQKTAQKLDSQYSQNQFNVQQGAIVKDLTTQQDAASQLQGMVDQANAMLQSCQGGSSGGSSSQGSSACASSAGGSNSSTGSGGSGSSGSGSTDLQSIIKTVVQLLAAVAAIVASIVALIAAIQKGDYAAAATIFVTIIGQLETIAQILSDALSQMSQASGGSGGSSSGGSSGSSGSNTSGSSNGSNSNNGDSSGNASNSADLLPVGDGKYSTSAASQGYIYACSQYVQSFQQNRGGANTRGSWFVNNNTQYDPTKKPHVQGSVSWNGSISNTISGSTRIIKTNDVPGSHTTGNFPISSSDPAYQYDTNPNNIQQKSVVFNLTYNPTYGSPQCTGHEVGVMLSGVLLFNALDERGRDAGAWETQDSCDGHPEITNTYHYHTLSNCIGAVDTQTVIGFALDGFPITGPKTSSGQLLTTNDLDECHGTDSEITLDGKKTTTYHYVMTRDFPYSVGCFRAQPVPPFSSR